MFSRIILAAAFAMFSLTASAADKPAGKVTVVFDRPIPNIPGKSMRGVLVEYGPGAGSPAHLHPKSAFIYATVLEGAIRSQINDEPEKVYKAGETLWRSLAPVTRSAPTPATPNLRACWPCLSSTPVKRNSSPPPGSEPVNALIDARQPSGRRLLPG